MIAIFFYPLSSIFDPRSFHYVSCQELPMKIEIFPDADAVAQKGAEIIAAEARAAVKARGRFIVAVSGGHTPWQMLRALVNEDVPWEGVNVVQVDERVGPAGDSDRNRKHLD